MRNLFASTLFLLLFAQMTCLAGMKAELDYGIFHIPGQGAYVETYLLVPGSGVEFVSNSSGNLQASVEISILFQQGEQVAAFDKFVLNSKEATNEEELTFNLIDMKRFSLKEGNYDLEVKLKDLNKEENVAEIKESIEVKSAGDDISFSDITLMEHYAETGEENEYSRNGIDMYPYVLNYYPTSANRLIFYSEIYNTLSGLGNQEFLVSYFISAYKSLEPVANLRKFKKQSPSEVNVVFGEFDITDLPSGNFMLNIEVRSKMNKLLAHKQEFFQRSKFFESVALDQIKSVELLGSFTNEFDAVEVEYHLASALPIAEDSEVDYIDNLLSQHSLERDEMQRQFLHNFWVLRNPANPKAEFDKYAKQVKWVDENYSTALKKGFESDRGIAYLKYGAPNNLIDSAMEPGAYPYEIWHYYSVPTGQNDVKFIFYNPEMAGNDFLLLHSDVYGEAKDDRWEFTIFKGFKEQSGFKDLDQTKIKEHFGTKVRNF